MNSFSALRNSGIAAESDGFCLLCEHADFLLWKFELSMLPELADSPTERRNIEIADFLEGLEIEETKM